MMTWVETTSTAIADIYMKIRKVRPNWFYACPHIKPDDYDSFREWVAREFQGWWESPTCVILTKRDGHVISHHLAFLGPVDVEELKATIAREDCGRWEIPVMTKQGKTIPRLLREVGFQLEGTLRDKGSYTDFETGQRVFHDIDMWARLPLRSE